MNLNYLKQISKQNNENKFLVDKRLKAYNLFKKLEVPKFKYGLSIRLKFDLDLDNIKLKANNGDSNLNTELMKKYFMKLNLNDKFKAMHAAFYNKVKVINILKGKKEEINLNNNIRNNNFENYLIIVEENANVNIINNINSKQGVVNSNIVEIYIKDNGKVNYVEVQNLNQDSYNFNYKIANLGRDAKLNLFDLCLGSKFSKTESITNLNEEGSEVKNFGAFFGNNQQQFDIMSTSIHKNKNTVSDMFTKGALNDKAKGVYRGNIIIEKNAFNSNGYQKEDTLLLSEEAEADAVPELQINNHDVKCSHGTTIGHVDKNQLFYLMSRGLSEEEAVKMIVNGFFQPLIKKVDKNLQNKIKEMVEVKLR